MSILHYFSRDPNKRAKFIFNLIAPIYSKVDKHLADNFDKSIEILNSEIEIKNISVLDIGSGTGAWAAAFFRNGANPVSGIDFAEKMVLRSSEKHPEIKFFTGDAENLKEIPDNSYDIVTASYVLHGVKSDRRAKILSEMKRVSKKHVVIHDFMGKTPIFIRFLEFMERSDYKNFKKNFYSELDKFFTKKKNIYSNSGIGLYIGEKV